MQTSEIMMLVQVFAKICEVIWSKLESHGKDARLANFG